MKPEQFVDTSTLDTLEREGFFQKIAWAVAGHRSCRRDHQN